MCIVATDAYCCPPGWIGCYATSRSSFPDWNSQQWSSATGNRKNWEEVWQLSLKQWNREMWIWILSGRKVTVLPSHNVELCLLIVLKAALQFSDTIFWTDLPVLAGWNVSARLCLLGHHIQMTIVMFFPSDTRSANLILDHTENKIIICHTQRINTLYIKMIIEKRLY